RDVLGVDQGGMPWRRPLDVRTGVLRTLVEGDGDRDEAAITELFIQCLPDRQVLAASSPGGPGDEERLATSMIRQPMRAALHVRQREVPRFHPGKPGRDPPPPCSHD